MIPSLPSLPDTGLSAQTVAAVRLTLEGGRGLLDVTQQPATPPSLLVGEEVSAEVVNSNLQNGQIAVLIKNGLFNLALPQGMNVSGNTLNLKVVNVSPNLTFSLQEQSTQDTPGQDSSVDVEFSSASKYLTGMLQSAQPEATSSDIGLNAAQQAPAEMADSLKNNVSQSGLFYESHLKDWVAGQLDLPSLQQEPQTKLLARLSDLASATSDGMNKAATSDVSNTVATLSPRTIAPELANLVQRQLNTLENQQLQLNGYAWPGQPMQMQIQQERSEDRNGSLGADDATAWSTSLSLTLPALGGLSARVRLVGQNVQVSFTADQDDATAMIQQHAEKLQQGMAAAGLTLANLLVKHESQAQE